MSQRSQTGYDARDVATVKPDEEVYLYDADAQRVVCASCNPSGGRPAGVEYGAMNQNAIGNSIWENSQGLGGALPAWTAYSGFGEARYQPRFLANSGRVFFDSSDSLVAEDVNGVGDVYEFEPVGVGGCSPALASGSIMFVPSSSGCVGLISSGTSPEESTLLDASQDGADVFFLTGAKLSSSDFDTSADVYDAHSCSAVAPCAEGGPATPPPCESENACKGEPSPPSQSLELPPTASASGPGNTPTSVDESTQEPTRAQLLAKALKACHKKGEKRAVCESAARKRYGTTAMKLAVALKACHVKHGKARAACQRAARKRYASPGRKVKPSERGPR